MTKEPMQPWLKAHLTEQGLIHPDRITRRAHTRLCTTCRQPVMVGLDNDRAAMPAHTDIQPLTPLGEAAAIILDRPTYNLQWAGIHGYQLTLRTNFEINAAPPGTQKHVRVVAEHVCGTQLPTTKESLPSGPSKNPLPQDPPF